TLGARLVIIGQHLVAVLGRDQRAHRRRGVERVAEAVAARLVGETGGDPGENAALYVEPLGAEAYLAGIGEAGTADAFHGLVEIGVVENDAGILAAEFEGDRTHAARGGRHDRLAGA